MPFPSVRPLPDLTLRPPQRRISTPRVPPPLEWSAGYGVVWLMTDEPKEPKPRPGPPPSAGEGLPSARPPQSGSPPTAKPEAARPEKPQPARPEKPQSARPEKPQSARPEKPESTRPDKPESARPTPVREAMATDTEEIPEQQARELTVEGTRWVARVAGRGLTGMPGEPGAPLLHITFHEADASQPPAREFLMIGTTLDTVSDEELEELFADSRPYHEPKPAERPRRRGRRGGRS